MCAVVREVGGKLVLDDPDALAVARIVGKHNCKATFEANAERVHHFVRQAALLGSSPQNIVVVVINLDDLRNHWMVDLLMPGSDFKPPSLTDKEIEKQIRYAIDHDEDLFSRRVVPFACGLASRKNIEVTLRMFDQEAAEKISESSSLAVIVVDHGVVEVFPICS